MRSSHRLKSPARYACLLARSPLKANDTSPAIKSRSHAGTSVRCSWRSEMQTIVVTGTKSRGRITTSDGPMKVRVRASHVEARLGFGRGVLDHSHPTAEDLRVQERAHQLLVRAVPQRLGLVAQRVGVLDRVAAQLARQTAGDDLLRRPLVDRVGGRFDLEHPVGQVLAHPGGPQAGAAGGALERLELRAALVDGDDAALRVEVRFDQRVLVLAGDLR